MSKSITLSFGSSVLSVSADGRLSFSLDGQNRWQASTLAVLHYYDRQHPQADELAVPSGISREFVDFRVTPAQLTNIEMLFLWTSGSHPRN